MSSIETCPDCGVKLEVMGSDTTHAYLSGTGSCWRAYSEILAREYSNSDYMRFHRWTVDAYSVQHPGNPEPRTIQSINVHLLALYLLIEEEREPSFVTSSMGKIITQEKGSFTWLTPPEKCGNITVTDVLAADSSEAHGIYVKKWAKEVWNAWERHHLTIYNLSKKI
jgi:hypothetical protein